MPVRINPVSRRISRNTVWILKPPSVGKVCLCQMQACHGLCHGSRNTGSFRQIIHSLDKIREYCLCVNLRYGVANGYPDRSGIEHEFTRAKVKRHTSESLHQEEIVEGTEESCFGYQSVRNTNSCSILNHSAGGVYIGECRSPEYI